MPGARMVCAEVAPSEEEAAGAGGMVPPSQDEAHEPETPSAGWGWSWGGAITQLKAQGPSRTCNESEEEEEEGAGAVEKRMREDEDSNTDEPSRWRAWSASWYNSAVAVGDYMVEPFYKQWVVQSIQNGARPRAR